ncbi:hypothetical protein AMTR_s00053p00185910 [Amborella trichopoda]|uniref:DUF4283 domain-containing protein n=1 Tax=Amborella trichopoda TaxID=13333 RepID=W1PB18_AMBTC|nr:hypothetical protein AMTR_s00053p00185910 [Amborella trichopoda]
MGRGYVTLKFSKEEDMLNVWRPWKIEELPLEYWHPYIWLYVGKAFGRPIAINCRTRDKTFGHFAHVQVEIDVTIDNQDLLIEREDLDIGETFLFPQEYIMEDIPDHCMYCKIVGRTVANCRIRNKDEQKYEKTYNRENQASNEQQIRDVQTTNNKEELGGDTSNPASPSGSVEDKRNSDRANNEESNDGISHIRKTLVPPGAGKSPRQVVDVSSSTNHNVERQQSTDLDSINGKKNKAKQWDDDHNLFEHDLDGNDSPPLPLEEGKLVNLLQNIVPPQVTISSLDFGNKTVVLHKEVEIDDEALLSKLDEQFELVYHKKQKPRKKGNAKPQIIGPTRKSDRVQGGSKKSDQS